MKKLRLFTILALALGLSATMNAQEFSGMDSSPMDAAAYPSSYRVSDKAIRITYSRPQLKGRSLADLAPAGKVWRTGANEAPEITFYKDVNFGGQAIPAGTYSLFTQPGDKEWTVILNKNLNQWGAYSYDQGADVARVSVPASMAGEPLEAFSIAFKEVEDGVHMVMGWDSLRVAVPITM
ncbi:Protein of unknown function [Robiginitalea myxolifaciens]|uniref:DUF2911 domain-containing protein n=1 Tax=Robiginitalea myxolifaciens TaxID=400055 RepID=A0A1I6HF24_9FLAO|nr:DUF2911 domain-containing protein [Robiginitalea myxolifaciens]SFR52940.1 Protein of unknown function [Robiginitalea myxolifaciens]